MWWESAGVKMGCCGTHVRNTSEVGTVVIEGEEIESGVSRIITKLAER